MSKTCEVSKRREEWALLRFHLKTYSDVILLICVRKKLKKEKSFQIGLNKVYLHS